MDATHYILFRLDTSVSGNWYTVTRDGGGETIVDTGVAAAGGWNEFKMDLVAANDLKFYIDTVLEDTRVANIPNTSCEPQVQVETLNAVLKDFRVAAYIHQENR